MASTVLWKAKRKKKESEKIGFAVDLVAESR